MSRDLEFTVQDAHGKERAFSVFDQAVAFAAMTSIAIREYVYVDVLVRSRKAARTWLGDKGIAKFDQHPDVAVFERIEITAVSKGVVR